MKKMIRLFTWWISFGLITFLTACGGGGGGSPAPTPDSDDPAIANLQGTWLGTLEDVNYTLYELEVTINDTGKITQIKFDGAVQPDYTATITKERDRLFVVTFSDGTIGGMMVDASSKYAGIIDDELNFGVLQKGASALPVFDTEGESLGAWSGYSVMLDAELNILQTFNSEAVVTAGAEAHNVVGSDSRGVSFEGSFVNGNDTYGVVYGTWLDSNGFNRTVEAFLSVDKKFAAEWACDFVDGFFPQDCIFNLWTKEVCPNPAAC